MNYSETWHNWLKNLIWKLVITLTLFSSFQGPTKSSKMFVGLKHKMATQVTKLGHLGWLKEGGLIAHRSDSQAWWKRCSVIIHCTSSRVMRRIASVGGNRDLTHQCTSSRVMRWIASVGGNRDLTHQCTSSRVMRRIASVGGNRDLTHQCTSSRVMRRIASVGGNRDLTHQFITTLSEYTQCFRLLVVKL